MQKSILLLTLVVIVAVVEGRVMVKRQVKVEDTPGSESAVKDKENGSEAVKEPQTEAVVEGANGTEISSRFNLNFNRGQSSSMGPMGMSGSQGMGMGMNMGIMRPGGNYQSLYGQNMGFGNSYSMRPYGPTGFGNGYYPQNNQASSNAYNMMQRIPLGMDGTALYSNLKTPSASDTAEETNNEEHLSQHENA